MFKFAEIDGRMYRFSTARRLCGHPVAAAYLRADGAWRAVRSWNRLAQLGGLV